MKECVKDVFEFCLIVFVLICIAGLSIAFTVGCAVLGHRLTHWIEATVLGIQ